MSDSESRTVLVTNAIQYAGPGAVRVLSAAGHRVVCHDAGFVDDKALHDFEALHPQAITLRRGEWSVRVATETSLTSTGATSFNNWIARFLSASGFGSAGVRLSITRLMIFLRIAFSSPKISIVFP